MLSHLLKFWLNNYDKTQDNLKRKMRLQEEKCNLNEKDQADFNRTIKKYLLGAGDANNYHVESPYEPGEKPWLTLPEEGVVLHHLEGVPKPSVYIRHQVGIKLAVLIRGKYFEGQNLHQNLLLGHIFLCKNYA